MTNPVPIIIPATTLKKVNAMHSDLHKFWNLPSGKHTKKYVKSPFLIGKPSINGLVN
jgi:hypothetical protein